eukprot:CAMPEP_0206603126 /NCGR_PEP_ID=MMETSP0325_2-20121206/48042_1 /ASSEMBLY_ACC=CAM_ASM_000347 /TAXON_ID=2866 /ORGANISM="Crypthecodinium cohnii, Strain Seligo" /LENGTH=299 /DNA_ID=CAMNT_0054116235 /DNA_START=187 /DNA_END=1083 /DNA_ORIENTATION=+
MADTSSRLWYFLLPDTGTHEFKVEDLCSNERLCYIDGNLVDCPSGTTCFTGPGASLLELRQTKDKRWHLLVNGLRVEDYNPGKHLKGDENSMRELRSMPEGSYTIAPKFTAESGGLKVVRRFRFILSDIFHEIGVAHKDWVWHFLYDDVVVDRLSHTMWEDRCTRSFTIPTADGGKLPVEVRMEWNEGKRLWYYALAVNHIPVPTYWNMAHGYDSTAIPPEIADGVPDSPSGAAMPAEEDEQDAHCPVDQESLPQGVSYDAALKIYQANIMVKGRFLFLGEFTTAEEAHERWQEEHAKL